ncbi:MAG: 6-pyruvoyl-tetrahydropterin synthase-related protein [Acidimicrobiales bacterium]
MTAAMEGSTTTTDRAPLEGDDASDAGAWVDDDWAEWELDDDDGDDGPPEDPIARARRERGVHRIVDVAAVAICTLFVFLNLHPTELLSSTVPAGGDMGAHVWGPAYLRDHLLPDLRLSGWTPDWYAGFPAYQFYMVVPSLLIVALDVGLFGGWAMVVPLGLAGALTWAASRTAGARRWWLVAAAVTVAVLAVELPYGTAFKLVTILGLVSLPVAAYAFGRLAELPFPGPALLAVATVPFLFDRNFTIYGGNVASTLAGEFAFSISLSLCVLYLGVVIRGLRTGRHRALAAVLLALTGLCHLIPAFYALAATAVVVLLRRPARSTFVWLAGVLPVGGLISAFWVLPFFWQRAYVNDMGWEKLPHPGESSLKYLVPRRPDMVQDIRWVLALVVVGLVLSIVLRVRLGWILGAVAALTAVAFVLLPQGRLWNARVLPLYYLALYLLAAVGVSEIGRTLAVLAARDPERPGLAAPVTAAAGGLLAALVLVGLPLRTLPFGDTRADGSYSFFGLSNGSGDASFVRSWARWNYTGYEGKDAYAEYRDLVLTMDEVGREQGCGRSFWEYEKELNRYGTPMALMLLPHWTDGCIGSMEGLFFEASATTPFHFLTQVELSAAPSAAQRDLPYDGFNLEEGIDHLQLMGVRYYLATSVQATTAAAGHPDLTEVARSGPWVVYQVADSELVEPLEHEPAVLRGVDDAQHDWICRTEDDAGRCAGPAVEWYTDPSRWDVFVASDGPEGWQRVDVDDPRAAEARPLAQVEVSDIEVGDDRIAFEVDEVGSPVLVKASYFPSWRVSGADGPYRVAPNLMVVVPTDEEVELTYGREPVEWASYALTLLGIALAVVLARRPPVRIVGRPDRATDLGRPVSDGREGWVPSARVSDDDP